MEGSLVPADDGPPGSDSVDELLGLSAMLGMSSLSHSDRMHLRGDAKVENIGLPPGWTELKDPVTHRPYYYNAESKAATWSMPQPDTVGSLPDCTDADIGSSYTRCDAVKSARDLTFFFKRPCKNGVALPPTVNGLPCNITCSPGQYLPLGRESCASCEPGTYSIGGGKKFMGWDAMPQGLTTRCSFQLEADRDTPCSGWVLNGSYIQSGDMKGFRLVDAILEYKVELLRAGSVAFEYRVDAERRWDGLYFAIDGQNAMQIESYQFQYKTKAFPLSAGFHTLQWIYHKDVAYEMGEDKAFIKTIQIMGTDFNSEQCSPCPKGYHSNAGSSECVPCAVNTHSDSTGAATCKPCPSGQYALPGATSCLPSKACTNEDIVTTYSDCSADGKQRTKSQSYSQPKICDGGVAPERPDTKVDCAPCEAGMYRQGSECVYCPVGSFNPAPTHEGSSVCQQCPKGSVAKKVRYYDSNFSPIMFQKYVDRGEISTGCANGFCGSGGWRPLGDKLDTGVGNGQVADVWLSVNVHLETWGEVAFNYSTRVGNSEDNLQMYVDDERVWGVETQQMYAYEYRYDEMYDADTPHSQGDEPEVLEYTLDLPPGDHVLTWVFHKEREYSWMSDSVDVSKPQEDRAVIESIKVTGVAIGGSTGCTTCPKGYVSDPSSSMCTPCPAGTFTLFPGLSECTPCPAGEYAPIAGSDSCRRCGHGTISGAGATSCDVSSEHCQYKVDDNTVYDLHLLAKVNEPMYGPIEDINNSVKYYLNLCGQTHLNTTCLGRDGYPIYGLACQQSTHKDSIWGDLQTLSVGLGDTMAFYDLDDRRQGLMVSIQGGEWCANNVQSSLNITMLCDMTAGSGYPEIPANGVVETNKCAYEMVWRSQHACPMCTEQDMRTIAGDCEVSLTSSSAGQRAIETIWKEPRKCSGGEGLPPLRYEACEAVALDKTKIAIIAGGATLAFLILTGCLVCMYLRNRKIYQQYSVLKEQNEAELELDRIGGFSLDEEGDDDRI